MSFSKSPLLFAVFCGFVLLEVSPLQAAERKPLLVSYLGRTPQIDGEISRGEWSDATEFRGVRDWVPEFSSVTDEADLSLKGCVKHDAQWLYFSFDITDDVLYGLETARWLPPENPRAHELTREGFPWFGDEMELLINATGKWRGDEEAEGNGHSWQMVCNLTKSRLGGIGSGGLLEGEPRSSASAWNTYQAWIVGGAQKAVAKRKKTGKGYIIEWAVRFNPCLETADGKFYSPTSGQMDIGLNIALGDLDRPEDGRGNFGHFHHEQWFAGVPHLRTQKRHWGTLRLMGTARHPFRATSPRAADSLP